MCNLTKWRESVRLCKYYTNVKVHWIYSSNRLRVSSLLKTWSISKMHLWYSVCSCIIKSCWISKRFQKGNNPEHKHNSYWPFWHFLLGQSSDFQKNFVAQQREASLSETARLETGWDRWTCRISRPPGESSDGYVWFFPPSLFDLDTFKAMIKSC